MWRVREELIQIGRTERHVALTERDQIRILPLRGFRQAAADTTAVSLALFVNCSCTCLSCDLQSAVLAVVADDNDTLDPGMRKEITDCGTDAKFIIVSSQRYSNKRRVGNRRRWAVPSPFHR